MFKRGKAALAVTLVAGLCLTGRAQDSTRLEPWLEKFTFIKADSSFIHNDSSSLNAFFEKLARLKKEKNGKVNIVHIGDSHIQADFFSGKMRKNFQRDFGNGGRGLIFPYRVAKTNGPPDYKTYTKAEWEAKRNVFPDKPLPIGISGITIKTNDSTADISIVLKDKEGMDYSATRMTLFHSKTPGNYDFAILDSLGNQIAYINSTAPSPSGGEFTSKVGFDKPIDHFVLKCCPRNTSQNCAMIFGIELENDSAGILYHMIGVNGAMYEHYLRSEYFIRQLPELHPDLVILSLGTNEAQNSRFDSAAFCSNIDSLVNLIRAANPGVSFLFTIPGDSFKKTRVKRRRYFGKNPTVPEVRNAIVAYCRKNNLPYWDLFQVMGGYGSMALWYKAGMADRLRLHFSILGYTIQGELFYRAIMKSYEKYKR